MAHLMIFATLVNITEWHKILLWYISTKQSNPDFGLRYDEVKTKMGKLKQIYDFFRITFLKGY